MNCFTSRTARIAPVVVFIAGLALGPARASAGQEAELLISPGKLSRVHNTYSGLNNCVKCHTPGTKSVDAKCLACHEELAKRLGAGKGFHRDKKGGCGTCHPEHQGLDFSLVDWKPGDFNHAQAGYPLAGKHAAVPCQKCHNPRNTPGGQAAGSYLVKSTRCGFCHEDTHKGQFAQDCDQCHALTSAFKELKIDHSRGAFPLKGSHQSVSCEKCHPLKKWRGTPHAGCLSCHKDRHIPSLGTNCVKCHSETSWKTGTYQHGRTRFPLLGKHAGLACKKCHPAGSLAKIPFATCQECHKTDPHKGQFQGDCGRCHGVSGWKKVDLDHQKTAYPLTGKHAKVPCQKCHTAETKGAPILYKPIKTGCRDCHKDIHLGQLAKDCDQCHATEGFDRGSLRFDHQRDAVYRLDGAHLAVKCEACHKKSTFPGPGGSVEAVRYRPLAADCRSCHADYHDRQLGSACQECHDTVRFKPAAGFAHEKSAFSLKGLHEAIGCEKCHPPIIGTVAGKTVQRPKYKPIGRQCLDCHRKLDHTQTLYALTGRHALVDCSSCHNAQTPNTKRLRGESAPRTKCQECHTYRHPGKQDHCVQCHTTRSWAVDLD